MTDSPLFSPDATCPKCGRGPRLSYTREQLEKWASDPAGAVVHTYQCSFELRPGRKCNAIYPIRAGDLHRARALEPAHDVRG